MPIHDWKRVTPGIFHDFHGTWIPEIKKRLNSEILPPSYYALIEQPSGDAIPDVLALRAKPISDVENEPEPESATKYGSSAGGSVAIMDSPPQVRHTAILEADIYATLARRISIRHTSDDEIVALIEIVSPGNKSSRAALRSFVDKAVSAIDHGYHLLVVDLFPPGNLDPQGMHGAIWAELGGEPYAVPKDEPLTLAAYSAGPVKTAYVEPCAVGASLMPMPLFLTPTKHVLVPLEETYAVAFEGLPRRWQSVLKAG